MTSFELRPAVPADARTIARLVSIASDGVSDYIWNNDASAGDDLLDIAEQRYRRDDARIGYRSSTIVCSAGNTAGILLSYPAVVDPDYVETDPVLAPMSALEEDDSYYICSMAVFEDYRGSGIGNYLLQEADQRCRDSGLKKLSLVVFAENTGARRLYERNGYAEQKRATLAPHPLIRVTGDVLLLVKHL